MRIHLIAIGTRMDEWINEGFHTYSKRLPKDVSLNLIEIPLEKRRKNADISRLISKEGDRMRAAIPPSAHIIAMEVNGQAWDTQKLSQKLSNWQQNRPEIALLIGGPDGLSPSCKSQAQEVWSLSALTLPHSIVRVIIAEQIYRAWSILNNHPYHR